MPTVAIVAGAVAAGGLRSGWVELVVDAVADGWLELNALIGTVSHVALGIALIRSVYQSWHARQLGLLRAVRAGVDPLLVGALVAYITWRIALAWAGRAVDNGRGQAWLGRVDRWLTERAHAAGQPLRDGAESSPSDP